MLNTPPPVPTPLAAFDLRIQLKGYSDAIASNAPESVIGRYNDRLTYIGNQYVVAANRALLAAVGSTLYPRYSLKVPMPVAPVTITISGKDYIVSPPKALRIFTPNREDTRVAVVYHYRTTRNGQPYGAVRWVSTTAASKSGIGPKLVDAAREVFNVNHDRMIAEFLHQETLAGEAIQ